MRPPAVVALQSSDRDENPGTGSVAVASDPSNAEIYVDGRFVGQTPSTLQLSGGSHHIEMKVPGKQTWARDLEVLKNSQLVIHAALASP
jgi:hypothetical protein